MNTVIHKFMTNSGFYAYEALGSRIFRVDHQTYEKMEQDEICDIGQSDSSYPSIEQGMSESQSCRSTGCKDWIFFQPACNECLGELLSKQLGYLVIELTQQCNMRCRYCCYSGSFFYERCHSNKSIDLETAFNALRYYVSHSSDSQRRAIAFYGGEPLLQFQRIIDLCDFIDGLALVSRPSIHVDTNGTLLDEKIARELISRSVFVQVSLDGPKSIHDRWRVFPDSKGSFDRIISNLDRVRDLDPEYFETRVSFAVTLAPPFDLVAIDDFFAERFPNNLIQVSLVSTQDSRLRTIYKNMFEGIEYGRSVEAVAERYLSARISGGEPTNFEKGLWDDLLIRIHRFCRVKRETHIPCNGMCIPGQRKLFVTADGTFHPCEKTGCAFPIGSTHKGVNIEAVRRLIELYRKDVEATCVGCWAVRLCRMCLARVRRGHMMDQSRRREACVEERKVLDEGLKMYASIMERNPSAFDFVANMVID